MLQSSNDFLSLAKDVQRLPDLTHPAKLMIVLSLISFLVTFELLLFGCEAGRYIPSPVTAGTLSEPLRPYVKLLHKYYALNHNSIHSAIDLTEQDWRNHHVLTKYFFKEGQEWNPSVSYLGKSHTEPAAHMVVAYFAPEVGLADLLIPKEGRLSNWKSRKGLLAIQLQANEEPKFVGVLWLKSAPTAERFAKMEGQYRLSELEESAADLHNIQRVIHHIPLPNSANILAG